MHKGIGIVLATSLLVMGCSIKQTIEPAEISKGSELCIIDNPAVRAGFLKELKSVLSNKNIAHKVVRGSSVPMSCEWTLTYTANWSWDMALYMSYAEIKIFYNRSLDGQAIYDSRSGGANMNKFIDAETKIQELLNELLQYKLTSLFNRLFG